LAFLAGAIALMRDQPSTGIIIQQPQVVKRETIIPAPPPSEPKAPEPAPSPVVPAPVETIATASALPVPAPQQVATSKPPPPAPVRAKPLLATTAKKSPDRPKPLYTVRAGDTLSAIAERELCNQALWQAIHRLNRDRIDDPARLRPGLQLNLKGLDSECGRKR
jgi:nucleoid-associated protein YgaU